MKRVKIIIIMILCLAIMLMNITVNAESSNKMSVYTSKVNNVTFEFPASWGKSVTITDVKDEGNYYQTGTGYYIYKQVTLTDSGDTDSKGIQVNCGEYTKMTYYKGFTEIECKSREEYIDRCQTTMELGLLEKHDGYDVYHSQGIKSGYTYDIYAIFGQKNFVILHFERNYITENDDVLKDFGAIYKTVKLSNQGGETVSKASSSPTPKPKATATPKATSTPKSQGINNIINLYVNGKPVAKTSGTPYYGTDSDKTLYLPLKAIVEGMGQKYQWTPSYKRATVILKDKTVIFVRGGSPTIWINGKTKPLVTKVVNGVSVPVNLSAVLKNGVLYVPVSVLNTYFKYPVTIKKDGSTTIIYVGKTQINAPAKPTPTPKNDKPITGTATSNAKANVDWMVKNLGFKRCGDGGSAMYNPINDAYAGAIIGVGEGYTDITITLHAWYSYEASVEQDDGSVKDYKITDIRDKAKKLLNFYLPTKGNALYTILDNGYSGKGGTEYLDKPLKYDGRTVTLRYDDKTGFMYVLISKK